MTKSLTCVIIDDDRVSVELMVQYLKKIPEIKVVHSFNDPEKALRYLQQETVDLLLLDIVMPKINGFNLLDLINYDPLVILTTSEQDYAYLGFEYNATDFLKKPVKFDRFKSAITKAIQHYTHMGKVKLAKDLYVRQDGELVRIPMKNIDYVQAFGDYVRIYSEDRSYLVQTTLKNIEEKLDPTYFIKSHRSYIVNIGKVENIVGKKLMFSNKSVPFSRTQKGDIFKKLNIL